MAKNDLYNYLYSAVQLRYSELSTDKLKMTTNDLWVGLKKGNSKNKTLRARVYEEIKRLKKEATSKKIEVTFSIESPNKRIKREDSASPSSSTLQDSDGDWMSSSDREENTVQTDTNSTKKPAQETAKARIIELEKKLKALHEAQEADLGTDETETLIAEATVQLEEERKNLKYLEGNAARSKRYRDTHRSKLLKIIDSCPQAATVINPKRTRGRPRIEDDQPGLLELISEIAAVYSGEPCNSERSERIKNCKTLDDLTTMIQDHGYHIKRSALYLRLTSLKSGSILQKKADKCANPQPVHRKKHVDSDFAYATINALESLASYLGPHEVLLLSRDSNSRVPLEMTTKNEQQAMLLQMEYEMKTNRNRIKEDSQKLIPSIYTGIIIKEDVPGDPAAITYAGPTFITVRSGKHSFLSASAHVNDLDAILNSVRSDGLFDNLCKTSTGSIKPVLIILADGGPNLAEENPRHFKIIERMVGRFREYDLDALYMFANVPGKRSFDGMERRFENLAKELSGLILPVDYYGHEGNPDEDLEYRNFKHAGKVLSEVWSEIKIEDHSVEAVYVEEDENVFLSIIDPQWYATHVRESQYLLQIVKCDSTGCCGAQRSSLRSILSEGFLPPPLKVKKNPETKVGLVESNEATDKFLPLFVRLSANVQHDASDFKQVPYDIQCPSVRTDLQNHTCKVCGLYFASKKSVLTHTKLCHNVDDSTEISKKQPLYVTKRRLNEVLCIVINDEGKEEAEWIDINDIDNAAERELIIEDDSSIPEIKDVSKWIADIS